MQNLNNSHINAEGNHRTLDVNQISDNMQKSDDYVDPMGNRSLNASLIYEAKQSALATDREKDTMNITPDQPVKSRYNIPRNTTNQTTTNKNSFMNKKLQKQNFVKAPYALISTAKTSSEMKDVDNTAKPF